MSLIDRSWPAFPVAETSQNTTTGETVTHQAYGGMTLRDYFAAQAIVGMLADPGIRENGDVRKYYLARTAYEIADAMLRAREEAPRD